METLLKTIGEYSKNIKKDSSAYKRMFNITETSSEFEYESPINLVLMIQLITYYKDYILECKKSNNNIRISDSKKITYEIRQEFLNLLDACLFICDYYELKYSDTFIEYSNITDPFDELNTISDAYVLTSDIVINKFINLPERLVKSILNIIIGGDFNTTIEAIIDKYKNNRYAV